MDKILSSSENVVKYNNSIREHIEQLSAETEEVTAYIDEAVVLNKNNRDKAHITKEVIEELSSVVDKLVQE